MRKKFLSAFMLGLLALGTTSTITSCKDYDDDLAAIKKDIKSLEDLIAQKESTINSSISALQSAIDKANADHATKAALEEAKNTLAAAIASETSDRIAKDAELSAAIAKAQGAADAAAALATENKAAIEKVANDLASANEQIGTLSTKLAAAEEEIGKLKAALAAQIAACEAANSELKQEVVNLKKYVEEQDAELKAALQSEIQAVIAQEAKDYAELKTMHEALAANVSEVQGNLDTVMNVTIPALEQKLGDLDVLTLALAKDLRSLVFVPNLYVDGIETIEYPFIADTTLVQSNEIKLSRQRTAGVPDAPETYKKELSKIYDYVFTNTPINGKKSEAWSFGPSWPVEYHGNPGSNNTQFADLKGWLCREVEVATRASVNALGIADPQEKYDNGDMLFSNKGGIITAGLKINHPEVLLNNGPKAWATGETGNKSYGKDNVIALSVQTKNGLHDSIIVSDYAMLYPERVHPEGIVWVKPNNRGALGQVDEKGSHSWAYTSNMVPCTVADGKTYHVWDNPTEALMHTDGKASGAIAGLDATDFGNPDIALPWNSDGIVLSEYIGTHVQKLCDIKTHTVSCQTWTDFKEVEKWGLKYIFEPVNYLVDQNKTSDTEYVSIDMETGKVVAGGVDASGKHVATQAQSSVGREPLVRIRLVSKASYEDFKAGKVKQEDIKTFLDAYILIRITKEISTEIAEVNDYPEWNHEFNLCDAYLSARTGWAEFDQYVLDNLLEGMDKADFDAQYQLDLESLQDYNTTGINGHIHRAKVFVKNANGKFEPSTYTDHVGHTVDFGTIIYYEDQNQTTNHAFQVGLSEDELEYLTHDKQDGKGIFTCYARYKGQLGAKYEYIYIKFTVNLSRKLYKTGLKEKNRNYWFGLEGTDVAFKEGNYDAIALNVGEPQSNNQAKCQTWSSDELITFVNNKVSYTDNGFNRGSYLDNKSDFRKFFFAPINVTIKDIHGVEWVITSRSGKSDEVWDAFVCHNHICCNETHDKINAAANGFVTGTAHSANTLSNLMKYRPDYKPECDDNLHGSKKYTTHKFKTVEKEINVVSEYLGVVAPQAVKVLVSNDEANADILDKCAIDYNDGCFNNATLYAVKKSEYNTLANYTAVATLNPASGEIKLIEAEAAYTLPLDMILNACGYADDAHGNISAEMRTWVGVVVNNGCDVAVNLFKDKGERNANYSLWEASWQRPINMKTTQPDMIEDANNDGWFIPVYDCLSFYDWRGPVKGDMEGANKWLWAYYNIQGIKFDLTPNKVMTNMHQTNPDTFVPMSEVSTKVKLFAADSFNPITKNFTLTPNNYTFNNSFNLTGFCNANSSAALITYLNLNKNMFGWIYYTNNGDNVTKFTVRVPVSVIYQWGHFDTYVEIVIDRTQGN